MNGQDNDLPTIKPDSHYAFKRGYRAALLKKRLNDMPSSIRKDSKLREQFELGWLQAKEELQAGVRFNRTGYLRSRMAWIAMTAFAGIATGLLIIDLSGQSLSITTKSNTPLSDPTPLQTISKHTDQQADSMQGQSTRSIDAPSLSLLSDEERASLIELKNVDNYPYITPPHSLPSLLSATTRLVDPYNQYEFQPGELIPKSTRQLKFELKFKQSEQQAVIFRWLWQRKLIHSESINANIDNHFIGLQTLASGWQGDWDIEVLSPEGKLLFIYRFKYGFQSQ